MEDGPSEEKKYDFSSIYGTISRMREVLDEWREPEGKLRLLGLDIEALEFLSGHPDIREYKEFCKGRGTEPSLVKLQLHYLTSGTECSRMVIDSRKLSQLTEYTKIYKYKEFCNKNGLEPTDIESQVQFLISGTACMNMDLGNINQPVVTLHLPIHKIKPRSISKSSIPKAPLLDTWKPPLVGVDTGTKPSRGVLTITDSEGKVLAHKISIPVLPIPHACLEKTFNMDVKLEADGTIKMRNSIRDHKEKK